MYLPSDSDRIWSTNYSYRGSFSCPCENLNFHFKLMPSQYVIAIAVSEEEDFLNNDLIFPLGLPTDPFSMKINFICANLNLLWSRLITGKFGSKLPCGFRTD